MGVGRGGEAEEEKPFGTFPLIFPLVFYARSFATNPNIQQRRPHSLPKGSGETTTTTTTTTTYLYPSSFTSRPGDGQTNDDANPAIKLTHTHRTLHKHQFNSRGIEPDGEFPASERWGAVPGSWRHLSAEPSTTCSERMGNASKKSIVFFLGFCFLSLEVIFFFLLLSFGFLSISLFLLGVLKLFFFMELSYHPLVKNDGRET